MAAGPTRRPGRPRGSDDAQLLDVARQQFVTNGYAGTTMDSIAAAARISKSSLYRDHASKSLLYAAVVDDWVVRGRDAMRPHVEALVDAPDTVAGLRRLAHTLQAAVLSPPVLQMRTLVAAEAARFPEVAARYVNDSWQRNIEILAGAFSVLGAQGRIRADAPLVAAEQFTWLVLAVPLNRLTLEGGVRPFPPAELHRIADDAVTTFLARFGPLCPPGAEAPDRVVRPGASARPGEHGRSAHQP